MELDVKVGRGRRVKVKENAIDRVVRYFNPSKGRSRLQARIQTAIAGGYIGASRSRRSLKEWNPWGGSANEDVIDDLPMLRARSRDLVRNTPLATSAINRVSTSVVGRGLKLQSQIDRKFLGLDVDQANAWQRQAERLFNLWAMSKESDASRTQTFDEQQDLVFRSTLESGDTFVITPSIKRGGFPFRTKLQIIEADRVENPSYKANSSTLSGGVELDGNCAPLAYHILKQHPGDRLSASREWQRVTAYGTRSGRRNVIHLFERKRPGQTRGVPYLAPVIESLKQLDRYTEAELMAAVISGLFTVFVKTETLGDFDITDTKTETGADASDDDVKLGNGAIIYGGEGESVETINPGRPNTAFDPFVQAIIRQIGGALEIPFELLIMHFTASYSASRAALLEAWRFFKTRRAWLTRNFCNPVYELILTEAVAAGMIDAPGFLSDHLIRQAYLGAQWIGMPQGHIQPLQEANAIKVRTETGITSLTYETAEYNGGDWDRVHEQREKEKRLRGETGTAPEVVQQEQDLATLEDNA